MGRPATNASRLFRLRLTRLVRGYLTLEERFEEQRLASQERQRIRRKERYRHDPEYRAYTCNRIVNWQRAQREAGV